MLCAVSRVYIQRDRANANFAQSLREVNVVPMSALLAAASDIYVRRVESYRANCAARARYLCLCDVFVCLMEGWNARCALCC